MRFKSRVLYLVVLSSVLVVCCVLGDDPQNRKESADIHEDIEAIFALTREGPSGSNEARARLAELPPDQVIAWVVEAIKGGQLSSDETKRRLGYWALVVVNAAETEIGFNQLIVGLRDPLVTGVCMDGLGKGSKERFPEVVDQVCPLLAEETTPSSSKLAILQGLVKIGRPAQPCLELIATIVADQAADERVRSFAAAAMPFVGGLGRAVEHFQNLDVVGKKALVGSLGGYLAKNTTYGMSLTDEDARHMPELVSLVLNGIRSPDADVRQGASSVLAVIEGGGCYVQIRSRDDYEVIPGIRTVLEGAANAETDPVLLVRLRKMTDPDYLDRVVEFRLRHEGNYRERNAPQGTP